jgi:hypothetical protein
MGFSTQVELLEKTDSYAVATWRRLMLLVWRGQANVAGVERSQALFQPWVEQLPGGGALLIIVPHLRVPPPDEATRAAMERTAREPGGSYRGMATLIEAEGFIAASIRSIMTRLRGGKHTKVIRTMDEAAAWAAELLEDPGLTAEGLAEAIQAAQPRAG